MDEPKYEVEFSEALRKEISAAARKMGSVKSARKAKTSAANGKKNVGKKL